MLNHSASCAHGAARHVSNRRHSPPLSGRALGAAARPTLASSRRDQGVWAHQARVFQRVHLTSQLLVCKLCLSLCQLIRVQLVRFRTRAMQKFYVVVAALLVGLLLFSKMTENNAAAPTSKRGSSPSGLRPSSPATSPSSSVAASPPAPSPASPSSPAAAALVNPAPVRGRDCPDGARRELWRRKLFGTTLAHNARLQQKGEPVNDRTAFELTEAFVSCPSGKPPVSIGPVGVDGSKWVCDVHALRSPCVVVSLGSNGDFTFEQAILSAAPCQVHTFDCTYPGTSLDSNTRHFYHKMCIGSARVAAAKSDSFVTLSGALKLMRASKIDLLKMDIEGFEYDVMASWGIPDSGDIADLDLAMAALPRQVAFELHVFDLYFHSPFFLKPDANLNEVLLYPPAHVSSMGVTLLFDHLASLGYGIANRELNNVCAHCSEYTLVLTCQ